MDLTTPQGVLLRRVERQRLFRNDRGEFWLHPSEPKDLPEPVFPGDVEPLIDAGLLVEAESSVWLGQRFVRADADAPAA